MYVRIGDADVLNQPDRGKSFSARAEPTRQRTSAVSNHGRLAYKMGAPLTPVREVSGRQRNTGKRRGHIGRVPLGGSALDGGKKGRESLKLTGMRLSRKNTRTFTPPARMKKGLFHMSRTMTAKASFKAKWSGSPFKRTLSIAISTGTDSKFKWVDLTGVEMNQVDAIQETTEGKFTVDELRRVYAHFKYYGKRINRVDFQNIFSQYCWCGEVCGEFEPGK